MIKKLTIFFVLMFAMQMSTILAEERGNLKIEKQTQLATQGDAKAQFSLGMIYKSGSTVKKDATKAFYWFDKAAKQGNIEAQAMLGLCYTYYYLKD